MLFNSQRQLSSFVEALHPIVVAVRHHDPAVGKRKHVRRATETVKTLFPDGRGLVSR